MTFARFIGVTPSPLLIYLRNNHADPELLPFIPSLHETFVVRLGHPNCITQRACTPARMASACGALDGHNVLQRSGFRDGDWIGFRRRAGL